MSSQKPTLSPQLPLVFLFNHQENWNCFLIPFSQQHPIKCCYLTSPAEYLLTSLPHFLFFAIVAILLNILVILQTPVITFFNFSLPFISVGINPKYYCVMSFSLLKFLCCLQK